MTFKIISTDADGPTAVLDRTRSETFAECIADMLRRNHPTLTLTVVGPMSINDHT